MDFSWVQISVSILNNAHKNMNFINPLKICYVALCNIESIVDINLIYFYKLN